MTLTQSKMRSSGMAGPTNFSSSSAKANAACIASDHAANQEQHALLLCMTLCATMYIQDNTTSGNSNDSKDNDDILNDNRVNR